ncbi:MAG: phage tail tape measure protein [Candidatus Cloacimonetes bacterium]|nr:phage tail tape measure protein [Candidatus Cloacimonadota bacterium]MCK9332280.1 phage tail tape measure protein [Candidatus Cloacimonadota bacterium]
MADNFGLKIGIEGEKEFKAQLVEINQSFKVLGSEMKLIESQFDKQDKSEQALTVRNEALQKSIDAQKQKIEALRAALKNASTSFGENDKRTKAWKVQLNNAKAELNNMSKELKKHTGELEDNTDATEDAIDSTDDLGDSLKDSGDKADDSGSKFGKLSGVAKSMGVALAAAMAAITAAAIAAGVQLVKLGDEYNKAINQIAASTGATEEELEQLGAIAQSVYKRNFGDSLEDVANGISAVNRATGLMGDELQKATESGFALRDTFGYDLKESAQAVSSLMKNFGITSEEAYNLIAYGAQKGADKNGDLINILNEFSAQYSALGLSSDEFLASLINGSDAGVFSLKKVGDAVKEFNNRVKEDSTTTKDAFFYLKMDADIMREAFAAGGQTAKDAFYAVMKALESVNDPLMKNEIAVSLFGSKYKDLEASVLPVLSGMKDATIDVGDTLEKINEVKYNDLEKAIQSTKRSIQGVFLPTISELSSGITDAFSILGTTINESSGDFSKVSEAVGLAIEQMTKTIFDFLPTIMGLAGSLVSGFAKAIVNNLSLIMNAVTKLVFTLLQGLLKALPKITKAGIEVIMTLVNGILDNLPDILEAAIEMVVTLANGIIAALPELIPAIVKTLVTIVDTLIKNLHLILDAALQLVKGLADGILAAVPILIQALPGLILALVNFLLSSIPEIINVGIELLTSLVDALPEIITAIVVAIPEIINGIINAIFEAIPQIIEAGVNLFISLIEELPQIITMIVSAIPQIITGILNALIGNIDKFIGLGITLFSSIIQNVPEIIRSIVQNIPQIITGIIGAFSSLTSGMAEVGKNLVKGLWDGIQSLAGWIKDKVSGWASSLWKGITDFFGIKSPSRKMAWVGSMLMQGLGSGIETDDAPIKAAEDLTENINDIMNKLTTKKSINVEANVDTKGARGSIQEAINNLTLDTKALKGDFSAGISQRNEDMVSQIEVTVPLYLDGELISESTSRIQSLRTASLKRAMGV